MTMVDDILMFFCVSSFFAGVTARARNVACLGKGPRDFGLSPAASAGAAA